MKLYTRLHPTPFQVSYINTSLSNSVPLQIKKKMAPKFIHYFVLTLSLLIHSFKVLLLLQVWN